MVWDLIELILWIIWAAAGRDKKEVREKRERGRLLFDETFSFIKEEPKLILFLLMPIILLSLIVIIVILLLNPFSSLPLVLIISLLLLFLIYQCIVFNNAILVSLILNKLKDKSTSIGKALSLAWSRRERIREWGYFTATIGIIIYIVGSLLRHNEKRPTSVSLQNLNIRIHQQDETVPFIGEYNEILEVISFASVELATFFVMPIIINEGLGVNDAVKKSVSIFRKKWGERNRTIIGFETAKNVVVFISLLLVLIFMLASWVGFLPTINFEGGSPIFIFIMVIVPAIGILIMIVNKFLKLIFASILYIFTTEGKAPLEFDKNLLENPWAREIDMLLE